MFPNYWRRKIASEAVSSLITFLFDNTKNEIITTHLDTQAIPSLKLLEFLGFKRDSLKQCKFI